MKFIQDLLNSDFHYLLDMMVVVFGVLIALFINNLNDNRKKKRRISSILEIVKENMQQDINMINKEIQKIDKKADFIARFLDHKIKYKELLDEEKMQLHDFLFAYPQTIFIKKEGYRLLRDADFDYDIKKDKILSEIIAMYEGNILNLERELDRFIRITERNCITHIQDDWLHLNKDKSYQEKKVHPSIENFLKQNFESSTFINDVDYLAKVMFGPFTGALEKYRNDMARILGLIS